MDKYFIEITKPAEKDLREIANYIAKVLLEPLSAKKIIGRIGEEILKLEEMPYRNQVVLDDRLSKLEIRRIIVENYLIFYKIVEDKKIVTIIRILFKRRDWASIV